MTCAIVLSHAKISIRHQQMVNMMANEKARRFTENRCEWRLWGPQEEEWQPIPDRGLSPHDWTHINTFKTAQQFTDTCSKLLLICIFNLYIHPPSSTVGQTGLTVRPPGFLGGHLSRGIWLSYSPCSSLSSSLEPVEIWMISALRWWNSVAVVKPMGTSLAASALGQTIVGGGGGGLGYG